jgi:hypothetical protein
MLLPGPMSTTRAGHVLKFAHGDFRATFGGMSIAEITGLPRAEKVRLMAVLWGDLTREDGPELSPSWHFDELRKTEQRFDAGQEEVVDWTTAKDELRRVFE